MFTSWAWGSDHPFLTSSSQKLLLRKGRGRLGGVERERGRERERERERKKEGKTSLSLPPLFCPFPLAL
jgi:hypothetical protein